MNLKERGITVGDLLIILIIFLTGTAIFKTFNKDKKTTKNHNTLEKVSYKIPSISKKTFKEHYYLLN